MSKILSHQMNPRFKTINSNYTVQAGDNLLVDTNSGTLIVSLPNVKDGTQVHFATPGTWVSTNWTINRNGMTIEGLAENVTVDIDQPFGLVYVDRTNDWKIIF